MSIALTTYSAAADATTVAGVMAGVSNPGPNCLRATGFALAKGSMR